MNAKVKKIQFNDIEIIISFQDDITDDFELTYADSDEIIREVAGIIKPASKRKISEVCTKSLMISAPGGYQGPWDAELTPYMVEPMNILRDRAYEAVVMVAPARTGKTEALIDGWACANILDDPGDMMIIQTAKDTARDYSKRRISRMIRHSPDLRAMQTNIAKDDNTFDKQFKNGMILSIAWPTINQLSGKDIRYIAISDYDRMTDDVDGEGNIFAIASKRTQTFLSSGKTLVESSPGWEVNDPKWKDSGTLHEAPPCKGILSLYNEGDRRKLYWQCKHCSEYFQPIMKNLKFNSNLRSFIQQAKSVALACDKCGGLHSPQDKRGLNSTGIWLPEGMFITSKGELAGQKRESKIASFWMEGPPAAFQTWEDIIYKQLKAESTYERTGDEESLKSTVNIDQGRPYLSKAMQQSRDPLEIESRTEDLQKRVVPFGVRFLTASIDVQGGTRARFVVQVVGWGRSVDGKGYETWLVDRYNIRYSDRKIDDMDESEDALLEYIDPARYIEDWDILIDKVITRAYPLQGAENKQMNILLTACDSGGEEGVTDKAYQFWRNIRKKRLHKKFILIKGASSEHAPRIKEVFPDSRGRKNRKVISTGDVPVTMINTRILKDRIAANMERSVAGSGYMHHPKWLGSWFYDELTYEIRTSKGWEKPGKGRNEAFDLYVYTTVCYLKVGAEKINWDTPRIWAETWDKNSMITEIEENLLEVGDQTDKPLQYQTQKPVKTGPRRVRRFSRR